MIGEYCHIQTTMQLRAANGKGDIRRAEGFALLGFDQPAVLGPTRWSSMARKPSSVVLAGWT